MYKHIYAALVLNIFATTVLFLTQGSIVELNTIPSCPTEDSCSIDYRNGEWHITPVIP